MRYAVQLRRWRAGGLEIATHGLAAHVGRPFDAPERPAQSPQRDHLLLYSLVQDIAHGRKPPSGTYRRQRLSSSVVVAGFQVSTSGRIWVSTEARGSPHSRPRASAFSGTAQESDDVGQA